MDTRTTCEEMGVKTANSLGYTKFRKSKSRLRLYDNTIIKPIGKITIPCDYKDKSCNLTFQIVKADQLPLISAKTCVALGLITVHTGEEEQVNNFETQGQLLTKESIIEEFSDVFDTRVFTWRTPHRNIQHQEASAT